MTATNFNTENRTSRQLLGNGLMYRVPRFQRDYAWGEEEWEDLWADFQGTLAPGGESAHYLGYLVLQTVDNRVYEIIDGQQRLTTTSLIVLAAMRLLKGYVAEGKQAEANQMRLDQLRATYIGYLDPVTLTSRNKLELNRNNEAYYRDHLVTLAEHLPQRGFPASTHAMRKAFEWFERQLKSQVKGQEDPGMALAQLVEHMSDRFFYTVITVADELNAYKVFETLNARGVRLSATDLLKNYLFSILAKGEAAQADLDRLAERWEAMVGRLSNESFPDFLRVHWNSRHGFARQAELFKVVSHLIRDRQAVFTLLRELDEDLDAYLALTQPEGSHWPAPWKHSAQELRMFSVRQPFPMLLSAKRRLDDKAFGKLLEATVVISFRYNVIGSLPPGEQERLYHHTALQLHRQSIQSLSEVLESLRPLYPSDEAFGADFAEKRIKTNASRNAKIVRYLLARLEAQAGGPELDPDAPGCTIEHLLPQAPEGGWEAFQDRDLESFTHRLGNLLLLEGHTNQALGNQDYPEKREALLKSTILLTREVAEGNESWTPEALSRRQQRLARLATSVWRVAQLS